MHATDPTALNELVLRAALPPIPESVEVARSYVGLATQLLGLDPDGPMLVASELVTNAVRHVGKGQVELFLSSGPSAFFVEVVDELPGVVPEIPGRNDECPSDTEAEGGRGLFLAAAYADSLEAHILGRRKSMSAVFGHSGPLAAQSQSN